MTGKATQLVFAVALLISSSSSGSFGQDSLTVAEDTLGQRKKWHQSTVVRLTAIPVVLAGVGLFVASEDAFVNRFTIQRSLSSEFPGFDSSLDDYLRYTPPAVVYGLDLAGVGSRNSFRDKTLIFLKANIIGLGVGFALKGVTRVRRPDNSSSASFPSVHTIQAFVGATFMHKELGHRSIWYSVGAYSVAAVTGFYRMLNNKHWLSDVLAGAALGVLSANVAYLTHQYRGPSGNSRRRISAIFMPVVAPYRYGFSAVLLLK